MRRKRCGALSTEDEPGEDRSTQPVVMAEGGEAAHPVAPSYQNVVVHRDAGVRRLPCIGIR